MIQRHAANRGAAGVGQLDHRHLNRPGFLRLIGRGRVIHVDQPTGINAKAKPQIAATVDATILLPPQYQHRRADGQHHRGNRQRRFPIF